MTRHWGSGSYDAVEEGTSPGDVFGWHCAKPGVDKFKYHVCLSYDLDFLFLNTPKDRWHDDDFRIVSRDIRFLKATADELSFVSCRDVQQVGSIDAFTRFRPDRRGNLASDVLIDLLDHVGGMRTTERKVARRLLDVRRTLRLSLG